MSNIFPRNLIANIFGYKADDAEQTATYSDEYVAFVVSLMLTTVPENVEEAILYRFKDRLTYEEIGAKMNCSRSRAQQLCSKGIRQLKCTGRAKKIKEAMDVANPYEALYEKIKENASLEEEIRSLKRNLAISKELHPMLDEEIRRYIIDDYTIEDMDLSIHAFNCLRRSGISTVDDLINILKDNPKNILQVKDLGEKYSVEIIDKVNQLFGYNFSKEM